MSELRLPWHAGRTTGRALYDGDGPDDLIGVMDSRELAAVVVRAVNAANAAVRGTQTTGEGSDEVAALTARLAAVEAERDVAAPIVAAARACFAARSPATLAAAWERLRNLVEEPPDGR